MEDQHQHDQKTKEQTSNLSIPIAIVLAGALVAGALYFSPGKNSGDTSKVAGDSQGANDALEQMAAISASDHIRGNPDAPVKIVEYSDTECPFCKRFHDTMKQVMDEYGTQGKVAWVYRQFPLTQLHPKAPKEAEALECAGELGGNEKFWAYTDRLFEITPSNNGLDPMKLHAIAQFVGLDIQKFNSCLESGKYAQHIEEDTQNAMATGGNGTPWSIIVAKNGKKYPLSGALPYESVKQLIESALKEE